VLLGQLGPKWNAYLHATRLHGHQFRSEMIHQPLPRETFLNAPRKLRILRLKSWFFFHAAEYNSAVRTSAPPATAADSSTLFFRRLFPIDPFPGISKKKSSIYTVECLQDLDIFLLTGGLFRLTVGSLLFPSRIPIGAAF